MQALKRISDIFSVKRWLEAYPVDAFTGKIIPRLRCAALKGERKEGRDGPRYDDEHGDFGDFLMDGTYRKGLQ
jgi:hypothetical protein